MPTATATPRPAAGPTAPPTFGVMDSIRIGLATTAKTIRTRLDIISNELEEQREWLQHLVLLAVAGLFCACMGMVMVTMFVVALFWESHPVAVLGGFSALYLGVGVWALLAFRSKMENRPKLFSTTTDELAKDEAQLTPKP
jgi:uncharacterized membrane protein YqjE